MQRTVAAILIGLLVAPPASAGQKQGKPIDWQEAQKLQPGTEIALTVTGNQPTKGRLLFADETRIITLKSTAPKLPGGVEKLLFSIGPAWPGIFDANATYASARLRVSQDGIVDGDRKLAELADVVQLTPRRNVEELSIHRGLSVGKWVLIGVLIASGVFLALFLAQPGCC